MYAFEGEHTIAASDAVAARSAARRSAIMAAGQRVQTLATRAYYSNVFPVDGVRRFIQEMRLTSRSIWCVTVEGYWVEFQNCEDAFCAAKKDDIVEMHVSLGPMPDMRYGCFFLDIDINECLARPCCGSEKRLCDTCLPVVVRWGLHLKTVVAEVVGTTANKVIFVLSGGKGIHIWARFPFVLHRAPRDELYHKLATWAWMDALMYEVNAFLRSVPVSFLVYALKTYAKSLPSSALFDAELDKEHTHESLIECVHRFRRAALPQENLQILDTIAFVYCRAFPLTYDKRVVSSKGHNLRIPMTVNFRGGKSNAHRIAMIVNGADEFTRISDIPTAETMDETNLWSIVSAFDCFE